MCLNLPPKNLFPDLGRRRPLGATEQADRRAEEGTCPGQRGRGLDCLGGEGGGDCGRAGAAEGGRGEAHTDVANATESGMKWGREI